jgi:uncharacterized protein YcbK (DUF882 family)
MNRRDFITGSAALAAFAALPMSLPQPAWAKEAPERANDFWIRPRTIRLRRNGERLESTYWIDGEIQNASWQEISWFLRDKEEGKSVWMQPVLLDILYGIDGWLRYFSINEPVDILSGYRTARHNANVEGAALNSQHTIGGASDLRHESVASDKFAKFGLWLGGGGVGWYPARRSTHVDRGRLRYWKA